MIVLITDSLMITTFMFWGFDIYNQKPKTNLIIPTRWAINACFNKFLVPPINFSRANFFLLLISLLFLYDIPIFFWGVFGFVVLLIVNVMGGKSNISYLCVLVVFGLVVLLIVIVMGEKSNISYLCVFVDITLSINKCLVPKIAHVFRQLYGTIIISIHKMKCVQYADTKKYLTYFENTFHICYTIYKNE